MRRALRAQADPDKAGPMQAYMKSEMPYLGVQARGVERIRRAVLAEHRLDDFEQWRDTVLALWREARYREERHAAIGVARHRAYEAFRGLAALPLYEEMIATGAWWDYVDDIASHLVGDLLARAPKTMQRKMRAWARSSDLWIRRSAILCQLGFKAETDVELLKDCIAPSIDRREFFLRKAIGWALREHAKTDPRTVVRYVEAHRERLSPLSKREALRILIKEGHLKAVP